MNELNELDPPLSLICETMRAFIIAVARQTSPYPIGLQAKIHELGQQIQINDKLLEQPIRLIRPLLAAYPTLQSAYDKARIELEIYDSKRIRGEVEDFVERFNETEIFSIFKEICAATDSFKAARKALKPSTNLLQKIKDLW